MMSPGSGLTASSDDATPRFGDPRTVEIVVENPNIKCCFCRRSTINSVEWGALLKLDDVVAHYFCLLFSAALEQRGGENEGICTILPADIQKEIKRGRKLKCKFCKKTGATIGCGVGKCGHSYHYPCGYENQCLHQFHSQFLSYCLKHKPRQDIPRRFIVTDPCQEHGAKKCEACQVECPICMSKIEDLEEAVWPPCCEKQLFHRKCIMHTAQAAGYFFKCPLCNSTKPIFIETMKANGVFVPEQDAAWEMEPNAFREQMNQYSRCDAKSCLCPRGRDFMENEDDFEDEKWLLLRCSYCGSSGTHVECGHVEAQVEWTCPGCTSVFRGNQEPNPGDGDRSSDTKDKEGSDLVERNAESDESSSEEETAEEENVPLSIAATVTVAIRSNTATVVPPTDTKNLKTKIKQIHTQVVPTSPAPPPEKVPVVDIDSPRALRISPRRLPPSVLPPSTVKAEKMGTRGGRKLNQPQPHIEKFFNHLQIPPSEKRRISLEIQKRGEKGKTEQIGMIGPSGPSLCPRVRLLKLGETEAPTPPSSPARTRLSTRSSIATVTSNALPIRNGDDHFPTSPERRRSSVTKIVKLNDVMNPDDSSSSEDEVVEITDDPDIVIERIIPSDTQKSSAFKNMMQGTGGSLGQRRRSRQNSSRICQVGSQRQKQQHEVICLDDDDEVSLAQKNSIQWERDEIQQKRRRLVNL